MKKINIFTSITALLLSLNFIAGHSQEGTSYNGMMGNFHNSTMGGFLGSYFMWILTTLGTVVLILFIIWLIKQIQGPKREVK